MQNFPWRIRNVYVRHEQDFLKIYKKTRNNRQNAKNKLSKINLTYCSTEGWASALLSEKYERIDDHPGDGEQADVDDDGGDDDDDIVCLDSDNEVNDEVDSGKDVKTEPMPWRKGN